MLNQVCTRFYQDKVDSSELVKYLCDDNGKGTKITFQHFLILHHLSVNGSPEQKLAQLFKYCDSDKNGIVSDDAVTVLKKWSPAFDNKRTINNLSGNSITEDEFVKKMSVDPL